ncbi:MAG: hypothetical protein ACI8V2_000093 [Candidatus Latescibacterota bacterium]|jgi:hypothetical protein
MTFPRNIFPTLLIVFVACNAYAEQYTGFNFSAREITTLASVGVTPEYIQQLKGLGYSNLSANELTTLYSVGVKPEYIKQIKELDYSDISTRDITTLYSVGVKPDYIKQIKELGYSDISIRDIITFYSTGVKPEYIKQMKDANQPIVPGQHIHVPEIHIPEIEVHIPEIHIPKMNFQVPPTPAVPPVPAIASFPHENTNHIFLLHMTNIASVFGAILLMGLGGYYIYKRRFAVESEDNFDTRIADFENRVNDLQDILLSIDDRLDRRLKRT